MKKKVAVIMGGFSAERHISLESGRNVHEKLSSSDKYSPIPIFLTRASDQLRFFVIPINLLLKDNVDDISTAVLDVGSDCRNETIDFLRQNAKSITQKYGHPISAPREIKLKELPSIADFAFIALHGHPGEDGVLQALLEEINMPYNGSGVAASSLAMDKHRTNELLRANDLSVAKQILISPLASHEERQALLQKIRTHLRYPVIVKPVNDGCSAGVEKLCNEDDLIKYLQPSPSRHHTMEVNREKYFVVEEFLCKRQEKKFLEITCGFLTRYSPDGALSYEIFSPSETLASCEILTLEEKFLAGEGQNITPARFHADPESNLEIEETVKCEIRKVAKLMGLEGYARIDAFVRVFDETNAEVIVIEANSLPALTPATCLFHQCILNGYSPLDFFHEIINFGFERFYKKNMASAKQMA